jgi:hypothetical protein
MATQPRTPADHYRESERLVQLAEAVLTAEDARARGSHYSHSRTPC